VSLGLYIQVRKRADNRAGSAYRIYEARRWRKDGVPRCLVMSGEGLVIEVGMYGCEVRRGVVRKISQPEVWERTVEVNLH
jgi:hypothetical protein